MNFAETLKSFMEQLEITPKELAIKSHLSDSLISRYLSGARRPRKESEYFSSLVNALYDFSIEKGKSFSKEDLVFELFQSLDNEGGNIDINRFVDNLNTIQEALSLPSSEIAKATGYDSSFISRFKNKERKPANIEGFAYTFSKYVFSACQNDEKEELLCGILGCDTLSIAGQGDLIEKVTAFLYGENSEKRNDDTKELANFLDYLNNFSMSDYVAISEKSIKVPTSPIIPKQTKIYYGVEGRKKAETQFLLTTLLSKSTEDLFFFSSLPIENAGKDKEFKDSFVNALSAVLKKGIHLHMVHYLNRPLNELLLGLVNWIPLYMSGSISPYYFTAPPQNYINESLCVSGSIVLNGEFIKSESKSRFYLSTKQEEVEYFRAKTNFLLTKAQPLMKIYREDNEHSYQNFLRAYDPKLIHKKTHTSYSNIEFLLYENEWVIINKENSPKLHFVIFYDKLVELINTFLK